MIETAVEQDGAQVLQLTATVGVFDSAELACVQELWHAYLQQSEASGYAFLVYRDGDRVLAYACFGPHALTAGTFDLYWIAVSIEVQGQGIAHALLSEVEDQVRVRGGRMILIETSGTPAYAPARRLYESCGYRYEAVIHDFYAPGDDLILFSKLITEEPSIDAHSTHNNRDVHWSFERRPVCLPQSQEGETRELRAMNALSTPGCQIG